MKHYTIKQAWSDREGCVALFDLAQASLPVTADQQEQADSAERRLHLALARFVARGKRGQHATS